MKFSIVTPSFNQGGFLGETLASVRARAAEMNTGDKVEHWVMDGGSQDNTLEVLKAQDFALWRSESDGGQASAINHGFTLATGDIFSWLCSDDLLEAEALKRVAEVFSADPTIDVVYGDYFFLEGNSGWKRPKFAEEFTVERLRQHNFLSQPAVYLRRRVWERFGGLDESLRFCADHEYWLRICSYTRWHYVKQPLASMRLHADAKSSAQLAVAWEETARMVTRYGLQRSFVGKALWMRLIGQFTYRARRRLYRWIGERRKRIRS